MASFDDAIFVDPAVDLYGDFQLFLIIFAAIGVCDLLCQAVGWFPESKSNTRYFSLHVLVNGFVTVVHFKDVVAAYMDPANAAFGPTDTRGAVAVYALHLYHIVFFRPLAVIDWVHHGVMVIVMLPLAYCLVPGHLLGHGCFYASGLPGGLDYLMLVLVKRGWMKSIQEKSINVNIQLWIRAPGCIVNSMLTWLGYVEVLKRIAAGQTVTRPFFLPTWAYVWAMGVVFVTFFWNGLYFLNRVIESHTRHVVKDAPKANGATANGNGHHKDE